MVRIFGAGMVMLGCGGFGLAMAAGYRREEKLIARTVRAAEYMRCDLSYRQTPLPRLCRNTASAVSGPVGAVLEALAAELDAQVLPDAGCCMEAALAATAELPRRVEALLRRLGQDLGQFDLDGQLRGLDRFAQDARAELEELARERTSQVRCYRTLGFCAGAGIAILLL